MRLDRVTAILICYAVACLTGATRPSVATAAEDTFPGHMKAAWQALGKRDVAQAKTEISAGTKQATDADQKNEAVRMGLLATCVERFWQAIDAELKRLVTGDELRIDGTMAAIAEVDAKGITLHIEGKNKKSTRAELPTSWARAIAEHRFDNSAPNQVLMAAFLTVEPQGDRDEARRLWKKAQNREPAAEELLELLASANIPPQKKLASKDSARAGSKSTKPRTPAMADPPEEAEVVKKVDVPGKEDLAAAQKQFKDTYAADVKAAKTNAQKLELSEKLVAEAQSADSPAWRYTLLREALNLTAATADLAAIDTLLETLDKRFKGVDSWAVRADAMTKAAPAAKDAAIKKVVQRSLKLLTELDRQDVAGKKAHAKAGQKLNQVTLVAAQRANDSDLVSEVVDRKKPESDN